MSACQACGNVTATGASPAGGRAAALLFASLCCSQGPLTWTPTGQASACWPRQRTPAPWQGFEATAPQGFEPRRSAAEPASTEAAPSGRSTDPRKPRILFNPFEGLSMEKPAHASFRQPPKLVPPGCFSQTGQNNPRQGRKPLIQRVYTLCEVQDRKQEAQPGVTSSRTQLTSW